LPDLKLILLLIILVLWPGALSAGETASANASTAQLRPLDLTQEERAWIEKHPEITVSNEFDWPPFDFTVAGEPQGFGIDLMELLAQRSGLRFRYINGYSWDELVEMFFSGKIDLLHSLSLTPERAEKAFFSPPYYHSKNVLILRRDTEDTNELGDLEGKIIALPEGWSSIQFFETYYPNVHIVEVENSRQALEYVDQGKVFASVEQEGVADYLIKKYGFTDLKLSSWIENEELQKTSSMHFAVLKTNPVLFQILRKALVTIQPRDMNLLTDKWFSRSGRQIGSEDIGLTPTKRLFLEKRESVTYCITQDNMPLEGTENDQPTGMAADFMELFAERLGVAFTPVSTVSWSESLELVKKGHCDLIPMINETAARRKFLNFTTTYLNYGVAIITEESSPFIGGLGQLGHAKIAVPVASYFERQVAKRFPALSVARYTDPQLCLQALVSGAVDAVLLPMPVASYHIRQMGLTELKVAGYSEFKDNVRIGVRKNEAQLHTIMSKLVRSLQVKDIEEISQKWVSLKIEQRPDYAFIVKVLSIFALFAFFIMMWNWQLVRLNRKLAEMHKALEEKSHELERLSVTDSLTSLYNRRYIEKALDEEVNRQLRYDHGLSVILIDLDYFKQVNDTFGHHAGDSLLVAIAEMLTEFSRVSDIIGRWGGEEFIIICPENHPDKAKVKAEHIRSSLKGLVFQNIGSQTASFGVAGWKKGESRQDLTRRADEALYQAKENGRDCVVVSEK